MSRASKRSQNKTTQQKIEQRLEQIMQRVAYFGGSYGVEAMRFTRNRLENIGSGIESINKKNAMTINYLSADLEKDKESVFTDNPFVEHTIKSTNKLFGNQYTFYTDVIKKLMPDVNNSGSGNARLENVDLDKSVNKVTDVVFEQLANFASGLSKLHLSDERRFNLHTMNESQRNTIARDIANQNRALATLGGVLSSKGLIGMLIDTIWLLIVSLRTIYQLSAVYGQPLKGKEGAQTAYAIIASSELGKMHDKQSLMTGLGIAQTLLDKVESEGIKYSLKQQLKSFNDDTFNTSHTNKRDLNKSDINLDEVDAHSQIDSHNDGNTNNTTQYTQKIRHYIQQIEDVSHQFNLQLDDLLNYFNLNKMKKTLALTSGAIGVYHNSQLIEQIIGTTQATFAPELKVVKEVQVDN